MTPTEPAQSVEPDDQLEHLQVLRLEPGDVLVYRHPGSLSVAAVDRIRQRLSEAFPGHTGIAIDEGASLGVVRREEPS